MKTIGLLVFLIACGGKTNDSAVPYSQRPLPPVGENAPGGVPGVQHTCCCQLPTQGIQLLATSECNEQAGRCHPSSDCTSSDEPSSLN